MNGDVIKTPIEISKELEIINFRALLLKSPQLKIKKNDITTTIIKGKAKRWALKRNKISPETKNVKKADESKTQLDAFQRAMKLLFVIGQLLGLNPVRGILETDVARMRFSICYWRFLHCTLIGVAQALAMALCMYRLVKESISIGALGYLSFYATTCITTFLFIQIGVKWPKLMKEISNCNLGEYVDPRIKFKCFTAAVTIISCAIIEHFLSLLYRTAHIFDCHPGVYFYDEFSKDLFPWFFDLGMPRYVAFGIILQILNITSTINWNYSDLYIVCISMYLASILERINGKIIAASEKSYLPTSYWRALREDYNRATRLVRSFDDIISGIIFTSFASNLFFICLQLFNILAHGIRSRENNRNKTCLYTDTGPLAGYEYATYLLFSVIYLFARSLTVSLVVASVHTASLVPAPALYSVPSSAYCEEVSRFIAQVNGDNIALSGLQFFYVTKDLVLSIAGTVVTYELVLLQFNSGEIGN